MKKIALIILAGAAIGILSLSSAPEPATAGGKACVRTKFKTKLVAEACKKNQKEAKKVMRKFVKAAKKKAGKKVTCGTCHSKTSGDYPLKKDGLKLFKQWGGE